jgi:hypothetical protein
MEIFVDPEFEDYKPKPTSPAKKVLTEIKQKSPSRSRSGSRYGSTSRSRSTSSDSIQREVRGMFKSPSRTSRSRSRSPTRSRSGSAEREVRKIFQSPYRLKTPTKADLRGRQKTRSPSLSPYSQAIAAFSRPIKTPKKFSIRSVSGSPDSVEQEVAEMFSGKVRTPKFKFGGIKRSPLKKKAATI